MLSKLKSAAYKLPSGNPWPWIAPSCPLLWSVGWTCCLAFHKENTVGETGCPSWDWVMKRPETCLSSSFGIAPWRKPGIVLWGNLVRDWAQPATMGAFPSGCGPLDVLTTTSEILKSEAQSKLYWLLRGRNAKKTFVVLSFWIWGLFLNWHRITKISYS